jgi:hypothetical protein
MMLKSMRRAKWATIVLSVVLMLAWAVPAQALTPIEIVIPPFLLFTQGIQGTVTDAGSSAPVKGIVVSAYKAADGSYVWSDVTDAAGFYSLWLGAGVVYKLKFTDPTGKYGEQWGIARANFDDGNVWNVTSGDWKTANLSLTSATALKMVVRRAGHPNTRLVGSYVIVQQKSTFDTVQAFSKTAGKYGSATFAGLLGTSVTYKESAIDPSGMFYSTDATGAWLPYYGGSTHTLYVDMPITAESKNVTITVPVSNSSVRKGGKLSVAVTATRKITTSQKMKILAKKGSTTKTFYLAKSSYPTASTTKYRKSIKLPSKGTWELYAVWPGSASYAITDSVGGKSVKVK